MKKTYLAYLKELKKLAKQLAETKNKEGWLLTLDYPSYIPFVTYAENRELRKKITLAASEVKVI